MLDFSVSSPFYPVGGYSKCSAYGFRLYEVAQTIKSDYKNFLLAYAATGVERTNPIDFADWTGQFLWLHQYST